LGDPHLVIRLVVSVLDTAIVNIALPTIARDLHSSTAQSIRVINAYQLAVVISLLPPASLGDIFGYRRIYAIGLAVFTMAALVSAQSNEWRARLDGFDVPNGVVTDLEGLLADPYLTETGFFERVQHPSEGKMLATAIPVMFSSTPGESFRLPPPRLGEHTRAVLDELGYSENEVDQIAS
jgi:MFS family permease